MRVVCSGPGEHRRQGFLVAAVRAAAVVGLPILQVKSEAGVFVAHRTVREGVPCGRLLPSGMGRG